MAFTQHLLVNFCRSALSGLVQYVKDCVLPSSDPNRMQKSRQCLFRVTVCYIRSRYI